ncbi:MAG: HI1506-related protein [Pseudomonadota bacterium]
MPVTIISSKDGFWRCGVRHQAKAVEHPMDRFSEEELTRLQEEPMLHVTITPDPTPSDPLELMTVAELSELLAKEGKEIPARAKKADLVALAKGLGNEG